MQIWSHSCRSGEQSGSEENRQAARRTMIQMRMTVRQTRMTVRQTRMTVRHMRMTVRHMRITVTDEDTQTGRSVAKFLQLSGFESKHV